MATVTINEKTKEGKKLLEFLRTQSYVTIEEGSPAVQSLRKSLDELKMVKGKKITGKPAHQLLDEL